MVVVLLGISLLFYIILTPTPISFVIVLLIYALPLQLYYDSHKVVPLKIMFLRRKYERNRV